MTGGSSNLSATRNAIFSLRDKLRNGASHQQSATCLTTALVGETRVFRESEYLDNTRQLIFWLGIIKQLNFRHFNTYGKKFAVTVNFIQIETKTASKRSESCPKVIWTFPIISEDFRGDIRKCFDCIPSTNSSFITSTRQRRWNVYHIFYSVKIRFFLVRETLVIHSNLYNNMGYLSLKKDTTFSKNDRLMPFLPC